MAQWRWHIEGAYNNGGHDDGRHRSLQGIQYTYYRVSTIEGRQRLVIIHRVKTWRRLNIKSKLLSYIAIGREASPSLPQTYRFSIKCSNSNLSLYYHICATGALNGSSVISSSVICVLLACITKALTGLEALLIRAILFISSDATSTTLFRFWPRLAVSTVSSSVLSAFSRFWPCFLLPLAT
jgi:hypothetical protein